jgi:hypothetical protein
MIFLWKEKLLFLKATSDLICFGFFTLKLMEATAHTAWHQSGQGMFTCFFRLSANLTPNSGSTWLNMCTVRFCNAYKNILTKLERCTT